MRVDNQTAALEEVERDECLRLVASMCTRDPIASAGARERVCSVNSGEVDTSSMMAIACEQRLSKVQAEIEMLLAGRPACDLSAPAGYRSLVRLESVLLHRMKREYAGIGSQ
jgi:hypothetical protein